MFNSINSLLRQLNSKSLDGQFTDFRIIKTVQSGMNLTEEKAESIETTLQSNPGDLKARALLIGFYSFNRNEDENCKDALKTHVLWVIENIPRHPLASASETHFLSGDPAYNAGKELWIKQVEANKNDLDILANAAGYMTLNDRDLKESFLQKAKKIDPWNPKWSNELSRLYYLNGRKLPEYRRKALEEKKNAFRVARMFGLGDGLKELIDLPYLARNAGDNSLAADYADELLKRAGSMKDRDKNAKCIHEAKNVLGLLAFDKEDYDTASNFLMESVDFDGEVRKNLHPRLKLAKLLLKQGLTSKVSSYAYKFTDRFGEEILQSWQLDIRAGKIPNDW